MNEKATNAMRIALALKRNGVKYLFGQSNPPTVTLACEDIGIKQIGYRQENAGTYMAHAYAMTTGTVPVVTAQNGPAATLLVAGLAESLKASYPVVAIVEEISLQHEEKNAFQELDHLELFKGVSKWVKRISVHEKIEDFVDRAFLVASSGRPGPTVLLCPKDIIGDTTEYLYEKRTKNFGVFPLDRPTAEKDSIKKAAELLAHAENPFIYAGGGTISSGASDILKKIQKDFRLPVATTTMGKGAIDENNSLSMGPIGYYMGNRGRSKHIRPMIEKSDVILLVGNRTNQNGTDSWTLLPKNATYIHIDIDPTEIDRNYSSLRLVGDAKATLEALHENLSGQDMSKRKRNVDNVKKMIYESKQAHEEDLKEVKQFKTGKVKVENFLLAVDKVLDNDHIIVADASLSSVWNANYITATENRKFIFPRGLAGLGWGLPMAMGAKIGNNNRKVFCLVGDGGFAHVWSELETCRRLGIDVVIAVINNSILGYQKYGETAMYGRHTNVCDFTFVDHTKVAEACGVASATLNDICDIDSVLEKAFKTDGSFLIDLVTDANNIPPVTAMESLEEMNINFESKGILL